MKLCVNGDRRPVQPPSRVLCAACFAELTKKVHALPELLWPPTDEPTDEEIAEYKATRWMYE